MRIDDMSSDELLATWYQAARAHRLVEANTLRSEIVKRMGSGASRDGRSREQAARRVWATQDKDHSTS